MIVNMQLLACREPHKAKSKFKKKLVLYVKVVLCVEYWYHIIDEETVTGIHWHRINLA